MIKLVEICEIINPAKSSDHRYALREIYVNPKHVVSLKEESKYKQKLNEGMLPEGLDARQQFTRVTLDKGNTGLEVIVIGAPGVVNSILKGGEQRVLKG